MEIKLKKKKKKKDCFQNWIITLYHFPFSILLKTKTTTLATKYLPCNHLAFKMLTLIAVDLHFDDCLSFQHCALCKILELAVAQQLYNWSSRMIGICIMLLHVSISEAVGCKYWSSVCNALSSLCYTGLSAAWKTASFYGLTAT